MNFDICKRCHALISHIRIYMFANNEPGFCVYFASDRGIYCNPFVVEVAGVDVKRPPFISESYICVTSDKFAEIISTLKDNWGIVEGVCDIPIGDFENKLLKYFKNYLIDDVCKCYAEQLLYDLNRDAP